MSETEDEADARRYRWLCSGNGFFLEENQLCGYGEEKAEADRAIDEQMLWETLHDAFGNPVGPGSPWL